MFRLHPSRAIPLLILNVASFLIYVTLSGGLTNVLAARYNQRAEDVSAASVAFVGMQIVCTLLIATILKTTSKASFAPVAFIISISLLMAAQNPFNTSRFFLVASWLPIAFIFSSGRVGQSRFYAGLFFAIIVLMPILSVTTRFGTEFSIAIQEVDAQEAFFHLPYIDVFDMLAYEIKYLSPADYFWGDKTMGMLLFFVPRSVWSGKATLLALDMGTQLAAAKISGTANLSLFFGGEFYADFGLLGVALGACLTTVLLLRMRSFLYVVNGLELGSFIFISAVPILLRGPLGAIAPLSFAEFISLALIVLFFGTRTRAKESQRQADYRGGRSANGNVSH